MTLKVTNSAIEIQNSAGQKKFDSTQRLVYKTGAFTGSATLAAQAHSIAVAHGLMYNSTKEFYSLFITITACTGNGVANLLNVRIPANNQIIIAQTASVVNGLAKTQPTLFSAAVTDTHLLFTHFMRYATEPYFYPSAFSVSFSYELNTYRFTN